MILDHTNNLKINEEDFENFYELRMALARLGEGLFWLYETAQEYEKQIQVKAEKDDIPLAVVGGILDGLPLGLLSCIFQWYAVSACNYTQLVGWIFFKDTLNAKDYSKNIIPRLVNYRNKIAAHFAITDPRKDNEADLAASVMTQIIYAHGRICAASITPIIIKGENEIRVSKDFSWSLTNTHERLVPRYWPDGPPKSCQALRVPPGNIKVNISWSDLLGE